MKIINTKLHGIIDYATAFVLLSPWIVDFYPASEDTWILAATGTVIAVYSLLTDYEFGIVKVFPMKVHLGIDVLASVFLIAMPFLFRLDHYSPWPVVVGITGLIVTLLTNPSSYRVTGRDLNITRH